MLANRIYPGLLHHRRYARNGMIPDARFAKGLIVRQNHVTAYRRKTFLQWGQLDTPGNGATGSTTWHRFRCHTGYGATHIGFVIGMGLESHDGGLNPYCSLAVTEAGGATTTEEIHYGRSTAGTNDAPNQIAWFKRQVAVDPDTTYEVAVNAVDGGRPICGLAYEIASNVIDESTLFFIEDNPSLFYPIYDRLRFLQIGGLSDMWKRNGSHLLSYSRGNQATATFNSTTWTNTTDATTAVAASSAGYYLGDTGRTLEPWCRISAPTTLNVVLAAYGSCAGGSTGEVRLQDSTGTRCSLTGITSSAQWHVTTTTIANVDTLGKVDLQARVAAGGSTLSLEAVNLYCYAT